MENKIIHHAQPASRSISIPVYASNSTRAKGKGFSALLKDDDSLAGQERVGVVLSTTPPKSFLILEGDYVPPAADTSGARSQFTIPELAGSRSWIRTSRVHDTSEEDDWVDVAADSPTSS